MNEILSIFLLAWGTCMSEIHLKQSGFTHSACRIKNTIKWNKDYKNITKAGLAILKEWPCLLKQTELGRKWKKTILLSIVGAQIYKLLKRLSVPSKPTDKTFRELVQMMRNH